ncbi:PepSY-associated TM helix domain-containing protein [Vibrio proteolyticus]
MLSNSTLSHQCDASRAKSLYFMTWRWHFYAGLFVIPFLLMLSITGLVMLLDDEIELARYESIIQVEPEPHSLPVSKQLRAINAAFPGYSVTQYIPAASDDAANRFSIQAPDGQTLLATVNPYTGEVLGTIDRSNSIYSFANDIHATLLLGQWGDYLIEVAASLGMVLLVSGIYLWLPRDNASRAGFLKVRMKNGTRIFMRDLHANLGGALSVVLLFFLISGLSWTGIWGAKLVQAWNTFPTYYTWGDKPESALTHASLNHGTEEEMPWNLEQATLPQSQDRVTHDHSKMGHESMSSETSYHLDLDHLIARAKSMGFTQYSVYFPKSETGVFTIAANSMAGQVTDPRLDRTSHFDQYSGRLLMDVTWQDYSVFAKLMAAGVSFHQGDLSTLNKALNILFCLMFIFLAVSGGVMWWIRRPSGQKKLGVPPRFQSSGIWKTGLVTLLLIGVAFPMVGITIIVALLLDWILFSRVERLRVIFR